MTGPSGAGKTTLARCLNGLIPHFFRGDLEGEIYVGGLRVRDYDTPILSGRVGLVFDNPSNQLFSTSVLEELAFGPENYCLPRDEIRRRVEYALDFSRLRGYEDKNPHALSGGEQQACAIAAIAAMQPNIFVLDEPTSNLDPYGTELVFQRVGDIVRRELKTMLIIEHKLDQIVPMADRLVVMHEGRIVADGPPLQVLERVELIEGLELQTPHATQLAYALARRGYHVPRVPVTVQEGIEFLRGFLSRVDARSQGQAALAGRQTLVTDEVAIRCENVSYSYPDGTVALKDVSLEVRDREYVGFIGRNGSGKTTLAKTFNGLLKPTKGRVEIYGIETSSRQVGELAQYVGYTFQNPDDQLFAKTVREELAFAPKNLKVPPEEIERRIQEVARDLELEPFLELPPFELSQGLRQRVAVGSVLTLNPRVLVVDEPTTGQDYKRAKTIMEMARHLNERGKTIIIISHNMDLIAEYCDRVVVFLDGKILLEGTPEEVFTQSEKILESSIRPPQISRIAQSLGGLLPREILTVPQALAALGVNREPT